MTETENSVIARPRSVAAMDALTPANATASSRQNATPSVKPIYKMKRTGTASLPGSLPSSSGTGSARLSATNRTIGTSISSTALPQPVSDAKPEPAKIVSDILPSASTPGVTTASVTPKSMPSSSGYKPKYATDEERRKAISQALKQRWASGRMDHVHKKRVETLRRRRKEAALTKFLAVSGTKLRSSPSDPKLLHRSAPTNSSHKQQFLASDPFDRFLDDQSSEPDFYLDEPSPGSPSQFDDDSTTTGTASGRNDAHWSLELWKYLQPHLIKHKGPVPPKTGWVRQLLPLPRVRDLDWNEAWLVEHPFLDSKPRDVSALIIQVTGELAPQPCEKCRNGRGPFKSCIMMSSKAHSGPLHNVVSCANCFYHFGQTYCTNKELGRQRADNILRNRIRPIGSQDDSLGGTGSDEECIDKMETDNALDEVPSKGEEFRAALTQAEPGRPYNMWPDRTGQLFKLPGTTLLPAGYKLDSTFPGRPWICPVRTCRKVFPKTADLAYHFERIHFATCLNDNGDGTFTVKGTYLSKHDSIGKGGKILHPAPPIVVSKEPIKDGLPLPKPQLPTYLANNRSFNEVAEESNYADNEQDQSPPYSLRPRVHQNASFTTQLSRSQSTSALISRGSFEMSGDILEMEDWEIAPGRIKDSSTTNGQSIAYSKAFLETSKAVPVCDDVFFRVDTIPPGGVLRLEPEEAQMRLCSIAAGKVQVKLGDVGEFLLGPHGMFKVKPGVECHVTNRLYLDAVLHTTLLQGFI